MPKYFQYAGRFNEWIHKLLHIFIYVGIVKVVSKRRRIFQVNILQQEKRQCY